MSNQLLSDFIHAVRESAWLSLMRRFMLADLARSLVSFLFFLYRVTYRQIFVWVSRLSFPLRSWEAPWRASFLCVQHCHRRFPLHHCESLLINQLVQPHTRLHTHRLRLFLRPQSPSSRLGPWNCCRTGCLLQVRRCGSTWRFALFLHQRSSWRLKAFLLYLKIKLSD